MFAVLWIGFAVVTAIAAAARGRNFLGWLVIGALTGIFGLIAVLVMNRVEEPRQMAHVPGPVSHVTRLEDAGQKSEYIHEGQRILRTVDGFHADGQHFKYLVDAKRHIDTKNGRYD